MKTSKIKNVGNVKEWNSGKGTIYYHNLEMENGDKINIGKMKQQQVGWELTYEIVDDEMEYNKAKAVQKEDGGFTPRPTFKKDDNVQKMIVKQSSIKAAVDYCRGENCSVSNIIKVAQEFTDWVMEDKMPNENDESPF